MPRRTMPCLLPVLLLLVACTGQELPSAPAIVPVLVQAISAGQATPAVYSGEVRARHESDLAFRVPGKLIARLVERGARVEAGAALARLDPTDLRLNAQAAHAQLAAAESEYALAQAERTRYAALLERKLIAQAFYDAKASAYEAAQARLEQLRAQRAVTDNQARYGTLNADHAGVVTAVLADVGQVVSAGQTVLRVARLDDQDVLIHVPEGRVAEIRAALAMSVLFWARPGLRLPAELRELAPAADPETRTYAARIRLLARDPAVQLGMTAQVIVQPAAAPDTLLAPLTAVVDQGQGPMVWVVNADHTVERRPVRIRQYREDGVVLESGVQLGEQVVIAGTHKLVPGQTVKPLAPATPGASPL